MLLALALPGAALAAHIDYDIGIGIEHNDNINLSEHDPISEDILIPSFGFSALEQGSTFQGYANGAIEYRDYLGGAYSDEFRGDIAGKLNWTISPDRLDFTLQDRLAVEPISTLLPDTPNNLQQTNVFALGPIFNFRMAETVRGQAELFFLDSYADKTDDFNSQRLAGAVRAIKDLDPISSISANIADEYVTFDNSDASPDYNRWGAFGRYTRKWAKVDLTTDLGYSWLRYNGGVSDLDRDSPLFRTDLMWHVSSRDTLSLDLGYEFSDATTGLLAGIIEPTPPGEGGINVPPDVAVGQIAISSDAYLSTNVALIYRYYSERFEFSIAPYYHKYDYGTVTLPGAGAIDQDSRGGTIGGTWVLRPLLSLGVTATFENISFDSIDRTDHNRYYSAFLRQQWARNWSWRAELTRNERRSDAPGLTSDEDIVFFGVTYTR
ncbi:MAG TPA: hypothetical protein VH375_10910 [Rhodanobacteraceae bacterium]